MRLSCFIAAVAAVDAQDVFLHAREDPYMYAADEWYTGDGGKPYRPGTVAERDATWEQQVNLNAVSGSHLKDAGVWSPGTTESFEECQQLCDQNATCQSCDWAGDVDLKSKKTCGYKKICYFRGDDIWEPVKNGACNHTAARKAVPAPPAPPVKPPLGYQPNFVFILTDDQDTTLGRDGYTDIGSLEVMSKLDRLVAQEGASFKQFYVNTPICCPSRTEFFSGRYYHNVGPPARKGSCMHVDTSFASKKETGIFGLMRSAGYNVGIFGKVTNDQQKILDELVMYDSADIIDSPLDFNSYECKNYYQYDAASGAGSSVETIHGDAGKLYQTSQIGNRTLQWLDKAMVGKQPFFAYIGPHAPHYPAVPAPWHATAFDDVELPITPNYNARDEDGGGKSEHAQRNPALSDRAKCWETRHFQDRWASLLSVDDVVEAVYDRISDAGLADTTYFVYTSDHGYKQGQWRIGTSKQHPYETDIRIPFLMRGPGITKGSRPAQVSANIGLLPTMLELAAGDDYVKAAGLDGRSMVPFLVPEARSSSRPWRHYLVNEYKSVGTYYNDHSKCWQNEKDTTTKCGGNMPFAPDDVSDKSDCVDSKGLSTGKCFMVDSTASNNWRQLRILNSTHNWNYVEYDPDFLFEDADALQHVELYDQNADKYQMRNIFSEASSETKQWLHETLSSYFKCAGESCP